MISSLHRGICNARVLIAHSLSPWLSLHLSITPTCTWSALPIRLWLSLSLSNHLSPPLSSTPSLIYTRPLTRPDISRHTHILRALCVLIPCHSRLWSSCGWRRRWQIPVGVGGRGEWPEGGSEAATTSPMRSPGRPHFPTPLPGLVWSSLMFTLPSIFSFSAHHPLPFYCCAFVHNHRLGSCLITHRTHTDPPLIIRATQGKFCLESLYIHSCFKITLLKY